MEAIEADNPDATLPGCPDWCRCAPPGRWSSGGRPSKQRIGREWETHEFQINIVSYSGNIDEWDDDQIIIKWEH